MLLEIAERRVDLPDRCRIGLSRRQRVIDSDGRETLCRQNPEIVRDLILAARDP